MTRIKLMVCVTVAMTMSLLFVDARGRADETQPPAPTGQAASTPKLFAFCMNVADTKHRSLPEQAQMLRELGFDGAAYPLWLGEDLDRNLRTFDQAGLRIYMFEVLADLTRPFDPRLNPPGIAEAIHKLKGRPAILSVQLRGFPPADPRGKRPAVKMLRQLGDLAAASGLQISVYNHVGNWTQSVPYALTIVNEANHPQVGVNFNLCHWLAVEGDKDYRPLLRDAASKIFVVTINGAIRGSKDWSHGLILPLDQGDFDNRQLLATLRDIGYRGPVGIMCYGLPGDARQYLQRAMNVWRTWKAE
jgi:sugar phosphate isomerase/epimerase